MRAKAFLAVFVTAAFLTACAASGPRITTQGNPATDLSSASTFNFMSPLGTDRPGGVRTPLSMMLTTALSREMQARGYTQSDNPDIALNVFINLEERMDVRQTPTTGTFHGYRRGRYSTWGGYSTTVRQYTQGTMAIDVIDVDQNMLAWEGIAERRLSRNMNEITQEQIDTVVGAILEEFPYVAR